MIEYKLVKNNENNYSFVPLIQQNILPINNSLIRPGSIQMASPLLPQTSIGPSAIQMASPLLPQIPINQFDYPISLPFMKMGPKIDLTPKYSYIWVPTPLGYAIKKIPLKNNLINKNNTCNNNSMWDNFINNDELNQKSQSSLNDGWHKIEITRITKSYGVLHKSGDVIKKYSGAGVLLIEKNKDDKYHFILFKSNGMLNDAGGSVEKTDFGIIDQDNVLQTTAKRELNEESRNLFDISKIILNTYNDIMHNDFYYRSYVILFDNTADKITHETLKKTFDDSKMKSETTEISFISKDDYEKKKAEISDRTKKCIDNIIDKLSTLTKYNINKLPNNTYSIIS